MEKGWEMNAFDAVMEFFIGSPPEGLEAINYTFRCIIGILLFDFILDIFRFTKKLTLGGR